MAAQPDCTAVLPCLKELASSFSAFECPLVRVARNLCRLEVSAGPGGVPRELYGEFRELVLVDDLVEYLKHEPGFGFSQYNHEDVCALEFKSKLNEPYATPYNPGRRCLEDFGELLSRFYHLTDLSLWTCHYAVYLSIAAAHLSGSSVSKLRVKFVVGPGGLDRLIAGVCCFRALRELVLEQDDESASSRPEVRLRDVDLEQLEASRPPSLYSVKLVNTFDVTVKGLERVRRRAAERGVPLEVAVESTGDFVESVNRV